MAISLRRTLSLSSRSITFFFRNHYSSFDLREYMSAKIQRIDRALDLAVPLRPPLQLHQSMRYSLLAPGKRVCPVLALASCELLGGPEPAAMPSACAAEMIHAMSLVHDDLPCMDDDPLRRGRPSNHVAFGEHVAVLAGDALLSLAFQHVAESTVGVSPDRVLRMLAELGRASGSEGMAAGQVVDIESEGKAAVGLEELRFIHERKSAVLAEAAAVCGAIAGGGSEEEEVERVRRYARCVGLAHQVVDDVIDVTRTTEQLGKTAGKDVARGKATYPKLMGIDGARRFAKEMVERAEEELAGFDSSRAAPLYHLARFIGNRKG